MGNYEWNRKLLDVLEKTYQYDATLMSLMVGTTQYSDDYQKRLKEFKTEGVGK
ncbi:hypothetical protein JNUCC42_13405 [Brevibacterium sp. JNUCC-42]|nr:hypothetical protein JNUCC42_13405 [Brevibacterium sp. JNUCC-42]